MSRLTVTGWQMATGAMLSTTVTVVQQVAVLPLASVTVRITLLAPASLQLKEVWLALKVSEPLQLSLLPLSRSER
ncbi:MAG: hypothetical protein IPN44_04905 [Flavobacteriales bacterium]|nr:hypothetical protein [Flavobacteriales bacterium]